MEIQYLDFDEIIIMQDGQVIATNVATGEDTISQALEG